MFGIGMPEMILILAIALIVIGPKKLPDLAKSLGRAMGEFKKATSDLKESMQIDTELKEVKTAFDDLGKEDQKNTAPYSRPGDEKPVESAVPDAANEAGRPEDSGDNAVDKLKAAFDRKDTKASESDGGLPGDEDASSGFDPDSETGKG
jgi:sec-independent protein translocase protein TatB